MAYILNYNSGNNIKEVIDGVNTKKSNIVTAKFNTGGKQGTTRIIKIGNNINSWCKTIKINGKEQEIQDTIQVRAEFPCAVQYILKDGSVIDERAFDGCSSANSITLPTSIIEILDNAFDRCSGSVVVYNQIPPTIRKNTFEAFHGVIRVPEAYVDVYTEAWGNKVTIEGF